MIINFQKIIKNIAVFLLCTTIAYSQDTTDKKVEQDKRPVRSPFESGVLIDNQTIIIPSAKTLEFIIHHRFGKIENGSSDLFGIYAPSNIRFGLNFSFTDKIMAGIGTTKNNKLQDIQWKWNILQQTRSGSMPVAVTYFGNVVIDARAKEYFGEGAKFTHRISYFSQLIIARKFNKFLTLQLSPSFTHFNQVEVKEEKRDHDKIALSFSGRFKFSPQTSIIFNYDQPLGIKGIQEHRDPVMPKPNLGFGVEISTSTHAFQIFLATADAIIYQKNNLYNANDFTAGEMLLGFNLTRLWNF